MTITHGAFTRFVTVQSNMVVHIPHGLTFEEAATIPVSYMTAYYALIKRGNLTKGEKVLIHSATGGVGMAAVNIAKWIGADILATAGNEEKRDYLKSLNIRDVMNSRDLNFADEISSKCGGVDIILNSIPGKAVEKGLSILNYHGRFLEIGARDILENNTINMEVFKKGISYIAINIGNHIRDYDMIFKEIADHIEKGHFNPLPYKAYEINDVKEAFSYMAGARHIGKIVIRHKDHFKQNPVAADEKKSLITGVSNVEGIDAFERIIRFTKSNSFMFGQVVVSITDFNKRIMKGAVSEQMEAMDSIKKHRGISKKRKRPQISVDYASPVTDAQWELVQILEEYLNMDKVGINDNFFDIGASSLDMIQINSKINKKYIKDTSIVKVYSYPTISQLANYLTEESDVRQPDDSGNSEKLRSKEGRNKTLSIVKKESSNSMGKGAGESGEL
jgi:polyketide synthase PksJ